MRVDKLQKPNTLTKDNYDRELWDNLEKFSYDVTLANRLSFAVNPLIVTGDVTLGNNTMIFVDASAGDITVTLPLFTRSIGRVYWINREDYSSNVVTVDANGSTINQCSTINLVPEDTMAITPSSLEWRII